MRDWVPVAVIAVLFVAFCMAFNLATPYRQSGILLHQRGLTGEPVQVPDVGAPDERQHANYVASLMQGKGIPVLIPGDPNLYESYQAHQPVLYYAVAAGWCRVFGVDPQQPGQGFAFRLLSTFFGLGTIAAIYLGARWMGASLPVAWASCSFALLPMSVGLFSAGSNDPLLFMLCAWVLALVGKAVTRGWDIKAALTIGVLVGLAMLTKTTAIALVPVALVAYFWSRPRDQGWKQLVPLLSGMAIVVPSWLRNMSLYGDPLAMRAFNAAFTGSPQAEVFIQQLGPTIYWLQMVLWWTSRSFIGVFGYMDLFLFENMGMDKSGAIYVALWFLLTIPLVIGIVASVKAVVSNPERKQLVVLNALFVATVTILFVRFNMQYFQGQARYLYPALASLAWCFGVGATKMASKRPSVAWVVSSVALVALNVAAYQDIVQGFARRVTS